MKPKITWPGLRLSIYLISGLGTPLVAYANTKGWIGKPEVQLWAAEVAAASSIAGVHIRGLARRARVRVGDSGRRDRREPLG